MSTDLWAQPGVSGSSQISSDAHRLLIGPLSTSAADNRGRNSLAIADDLWWGWVEPNFNRSTCYTTDCDPTAQSQLNEAFISTLGVPFPSLYYGYVDANEDGLFDLQVAIEAILGEARRDWYWLGFESARRNKLWGTGVVRFDVSDPITGIADLQAIQTGYAPTLWHDQLHLEPDRVYRVSFMTNTVQRAAVRPIRVCLVSAEEQCAEFDPPVGSWMINVAQLRASGTDARLRFDLRGNGTRILVAAVSVIGDGSFMDFDSHDKRYMWRNHNNGGRGLIWPNGIHASASRADWAGVVRRDPDQPLADDWPLRNRQLGIDGGRQYRVCFSHRSSDREPLTQGGSLYGLIRVIDGGGTIQATSFAPADTWERECTGWFVPPTDDNNLQFGMTSLTPTSAKGAYLVDDILVQERPSTVFVDWRNSDGEDGSEKYPYNTVREGVLVVRDAGDVRVVAGTYTGTLVIDRRMTLRTTEGVARIGG